MARQDEGNSANGGFGGNPGERSSRNKDTSNWSGAPPSMAPAAKPHNRNQPPAPPATPENVTVQPASRSSDLQLKLADLYARENFSDGAPFDETYLLLNQRELAKAFMEKHKKEFAQLYLANHYAMENGLDLAYVDKYPEQLAQNYIMGHALELARGYVAEHRVQLAEEFLASNQMDLAQSFVEEHQLDLAQRYVSEYTDRLEKLMEEKCAQAALEKRRQAAPTSASIATLAQAPAQSPVQAPIEVPVQPAVIYAPQTPAPSAAAASGDVLADVPTMAILTKKTAEYSTMSSGQAVTEEMPISNYRPMPRLRPRRRTTTTQLPVVNSGQVQPAASAYQDTTAQPVQPAVQPSVPVRPVVPAQSAQTQELPLYSTGQTTYDSYPASDLSNLPDDYKASPSQSYASQTNASTDAAPAASPTESYAPPTATQANTAASSSGSFQAVGSEPYQRPSNVSSQLPDDQYRAQNVSHAPVEQESILPGSEPEPRRLQSNAPPPLSGDYTNDARNAVLWDQLAQVPLSSDGFGYADGPPVSSGAGFNNLTQPAWENSGFPYQRVESAPLGMEQFMSTLSDSAISAQANPGGSLSRFGSPPPSLRSEGAAAEVTSAWF